MSDARRVYQIGDEVWVLATLPEQVVTHMLVPVEWQAIPDAQIDEARAESQRLIESRHETERMRGHGMRRGLSILGLVRCGKCDGQGRWIRKMTKDPYENTAHVCPVCDGHGWVKT